VIVNQEFQDACTPFMLNYFRRCGLFLVSVGLVTPKYRPKSHDLRFLLYHQFLWKFNKYFRRVLLVTPSETVFQTDPFTTSFGRGNLSLATECHTYEQSRWAIDKILLVDPRTDPDFYAKKRIVNAGLVWGSVQEVVKFLNYLIESRFFHTFPMADFEFQADTAVVGHMVYHQMFEKNNISVDLELGTEPFGALSFCKYRITNEKVLMRKTTRSNIVMSVIYQFNRYWGVLNWTKQACPAAGDDYRLAFANPGPVFFLW
jgi:hypothetical protein